MFNRSKRRLLFSATALLLLIALFVNACVSAIANNTISIPKATISQTSEPIINTIERDAVSDQEISKNVNRIIKTLGLDSYTDLVFSAHVENGVVIFEGTLLYYDEENLLNSLSGVDGIVNIICNYELLAE
ncbi:MAG: hypothetical protein JSV74_00730 [Dehalococcoidia bacterium]|nr:MAG: hypothetical protein JSV74_00730 [Dehalococcoidia bacterium]